MEVNPDISYGDWTPIVETATETVDLTQVRKFANVLDIDETTFEDGGELPSMWHWLFFLHRAPTAKIGLDGHPERGGFFPPVELQRRMFAGERVKFHAPLVIGQPATRTGTITRLDEKEGRAGRMVLATAQYQIEQGGALCIEDTHDIIYIAGGGQTPAPGPDDFTPPEGTWHREVKADPVLLFRFSALTFNSHRIHYDADYARNEEGYPDLVVHGPLMATELCDALTGHQAVVPCRYTYRAQAPVFTTTPVRIEAGAPGPDREGQIRRSDGVVSMTGRLQAL